MIKFEVEGTVGPGILGASWSPDDSLLALVTGRLNETTLLFVLIKYRLYLGEEKLILMTSTFDVSTEMPLHSIDFGEGSFSCIRFTYLF